MISRWRRRQGRPGSRERFQGDAERLGETTGGLIVERRVLLRPAGDLPPLRLNGADVGIGSGEPAGELLAGDARLAQRLEQPAPLRLSHSHMGHSARSGPKVPVRRFSAVM